MTRWLATSMLLGLGGATLAADDTALRTLDACRARLDPRVDVGLERIEKRCPELMPALQNAPWAALLPKDMRERRDEISAESLRELGALVRQVNAELAQQAGTPAEELAAGSPRRPPDVATLAPVLESLGDKGQQGVTRWERFKRWLRDKIERNQQIEEEQDSWIESLGQQFETSEGVARLITHVGRGLLALLVAYIVWTELRAAGFLGGRKRGEARAAAAADWRRRLQLTDIMAAPLADRPGLLLQLLGESLTRSRRLPTAAAGLTAGALVRQARLDDEADRAGLEQVAMTAEAVRFGPRQPEPAQIEGAVSVARALLDKLARASGKLRKVAR